MNKHHEVEPTEVSAAVTFFQKFIKDLAQTPEVLAELLEGIQAEATPGGEVYELPVEGPGDAALVVMRHGQHRISDLEAHQGETELHFPIAGRASFWNAGAETEIGRGDHVVVDQSTPHFFTPIEAEGDFASLVVSVPGFDPANLIVLSEGLTTPPELATGTEAYLGKIATFGV
jgi:mannose-6-phosphate isomerase-like protein (cupin superfamily)